MRHGCDSCLGGDQFTLRVKLPLVGGARVPVGGVFATVRGGAHGESLQFQRRFWRGVRAPRRRLCFQLLALRLVPQRERWPPMRRLSPRSRYFWVYFAQKKKCPQRQPEKYGHQYKVGSFFFSGFCETLIPCLSLRNPKIFPGLDHIGCAAVVKLSQAGTWPKEVFYEMEGTNPASPPNINSTRPVVAKCIRERGDVAKNMETF